MNNAGQPHNSTPKVVQQPPIEKLAAFYQRDTSLYAYNLGDLEPIHASSTKWWGLSQPSNGEILATLLVYSGFAHHTILALTDDKYQMHLVERVLYQLPDCAHLCFRKSVRDVIEQRYVVRQVSPMFKMRWENDSASLLPVADELRAVTPLDLSQADMISELYSHAYPAAAVSELSLKSGHYIGIFDSDTLVSVGCFHILSQRYGVATIGGIATHPTFRGRGYARLITAALIEKARAVAPTIGLNVNQENSTACSIYRKLGFVATHEYCETDIVAKNFAGE